MRQFNEYLSVLHVSPFVRCNIELGKGIGESYFAILSFQGFYVFVIAKYTEYPGLINPILCVNHG